MIRNINLNSHFLVGGSEQLLNSSTSSPSPSPTMIRYGITKPILLAGPTEADLLRNAELGRYLVNSGLYESKEEGEKREDVLNRIHENNFCLKSLISFGARVSV